MAHLFEPLALRGIVLKNRIGIPPMCQYSAIDGIAGEWHFVHYGSCAAGGAALLIVEATAVTPDGRISPGDLGIWCDEQIEPLGRIARFAAGQGCVPAIQLAHAGRKGSTGLGWQPSGSLGQGGWPVSAPSALSFGPGYDTPLELDVEGIRDVVDSFVSGARRALAAGFQCVEIHAAHGYLLHQFLSPLSNLRRDEWGGCFENRIRLVSTVVREVREVWPDRLPLLIRLSATDWVEGGWNPDETALLCRILKDLGVDLVDVSSAGLVPDAAIPAGPGFQCGFSSRVRREAGIMTAAVGMITSPEQADHVVRSEQADLVLIGREVLRNPHWPLAAASALRQHTDWPNPYLRAAR